MSLLRTFTDRRSAPAAALRGILTTGLQAGAGIALARAAGPDIRGRVAVVVTAATLVAVVASMGLDVSVRFRLPSLRACHGEAAARRAYRFAAWASGLGGAVLAASVGNYYLRTLDWFHWGMLVLLVVSATASLGANLERGLLRAHGDTTRGADSEMWAAAALLAGYVGLLVGGLDEAGTAVAVFVVSSSVGWAAAYRFQPKPEPPGSSCRAARRGGIAVGLVKHGASVHRGTIATAISYRSDRVLLPLFVPTSEIGLYAVAVSLSELVALVPTAVSHVVLARSALSEGRGITQLRLRVMALSAVLAMAIWVGAESIIRFAFGEEFSGAASLVGPLVLASIVQAYWRLRVSQSVGAGSTHEFVTSAWVGAAGVVVGILALAPSFGVQAAAWASVAGYGAGLAVFLILGADR